MFSNASRVLSQCNTRLRLLYLLNRYSTVRKVDPRRQFHTFLVIRIKSLLPGRSVMQGQSPLEILTKYSKVGGGGIVSSDLATIRPHCVCVVSMVGSAAEWLRHPTGNLETQVQFPAESYFHLFP